MKVNLQISNPSKSYVTLKAKDYADAAAKLAGKPFAACYEANPGYAFKYDGAGNTNEITLKAKPTISLPKWDGAKKLKGDEKKNWDAMLKALAKHEDNHHKLFVADARKFQKDTEAAGDFPKAETKARMSAFFDLGQATQDKYDKDSKHGAKEGVVLPT